MQIYLLIYYGGCVELGERSIELATQVCQHHGCSVSMSRFVSDRDARWDLTQRSADATMARSDSEDGEGFGNDKEEELDNENEEGEDTDAEGDLDAEGEVDSEGDEVRALRVATQFM
jgi:hypothetical protein